MTREYSEGDVLIFQLESGYGLLKVLAIDENADEIVWHIAAFEDLFLDAETADMALAMPDAMAFSFPHLALTNRAFRSTQTARMTNFPITESEQAIVRAWRENPSSQIYDRSIRLMLGLR